MIEAAPMIPASFRKSRRSTLTFHAAHGMAWAGADRLIHKDR